MNLRWPLLKTVSRDGREINPDDRMDARCQAISGLDGFRRRQAPAIECCVAAMTLMLKDAGFF
jgi:hypothetical protein